MQYDWLIKYLHKQAGVQVYLIKWPLNNGFSELENRWNSRTNGGNWENFPFNPENFGGNLSFNLGQIAVADCISHGDGHYSVCYLPPPLHNQTFQFSQK